ncbi:MAG: hypothetical protein EOO31_09025 [Comamonadaceae bacterium]|nr:MAG: hypothetical protein EOO31_09025 [Comamonadaceae bacterium]
MNSVFPSPHRVVPLTLRLVFDNLRYYTVLAFMWVGVKLLRQDTGWPAELGAPVLASLTIGLGLLTAWQTMWIAFSAVFTTASMLLPPRLAVRLRRRLRDRDALLLGFAFIVGILVYCTVLVLGASILGTLSRSNLL